MHKLKQILKIKCLNVSEPVTTCQLQLPEHPSVYCSRVDSCVNNIQSNLLIVWKKFDFFTYLNWFLKNPGIQKQFVFTFICLSPVKGNLVPVSQLSSEV